MNGSAIKAGFDLHISVSDVRMLSQTLIICTFCQENYQTNGSTLQPIYSFNTICLCPSDKDQPLGTGQKVLGWETGAGEGGGSLVFESLVSDGSLNFQLTWGWVILFYNRSWHTFQTLYDNCFSSHKVVRMDRNYYCIKTKNL